MQKNLIMIFSLVIWVQSNVAQETIGKRIYTTKRIDTNAPVIDGKLIDNCWDIVDWGADFIQKSPYEGEKPTQHFSHSLNFTIDVLTSGNYFIVVEAYDELGNSVFSKPVSVEV